MIRAEVYQREDGLYDWRLIESGNNETLGGSMQGFTEKNDANEALVKLLTEVGVVGRFMEIRDVSAHQDEAPSS